MIKWHIGNEDITFWAEIGYLLYQIQVFQGTSGEICWTWLAVQTQYTGLSIILLYMTAHNWKEWLHCLPTVVLLPVWAGSPLNFMPKLSLWHHYERWAKVSSISSSILIPNHQIHLLIRNKNLTCSAITMQIIDILDRTWLLANLRVTT